MAILTAEQIMAAEDRTFEDVDVPEWGGTVRLRVMGASVRRAWEKRMAALDKDESVDSRTLLVAACACEENLNYLFVRFDAQQQPEFLFDDFRALANKSSVAIHKLVPVAMRLNTVGEAEDDAEKK
jgi:hypothetical protein